jgi:hypothetical protein
MRKGLFAVCLVSLFALWGAGPRRAVAGGTGSPHFNSASANVISNNLVLSWKEVGLGSESGANVTYEAAADAAAVYQCFNNGGRHPQAGNKTTVNTAVTGKGTFPVSKNGTISGSLTLEAPGAGGFTCPSGQHLVLVSVSYTAPTGADLAAVCGSDGVGCGDTANGSIFLEDQTNDIQATVSF